MIQNTYIHIPFCRLKCKYCSFVSFLNFNYVNDYFESLKKEIEYYYKNENQNTLYIGGGTPSSIDIDKINEIIKMFKFCRTDCEITIEINPNDVNEEYLQKLKKTNINRISVGVQSFNDEILKFIGRQHSGSEAINAVKKISEAGFKNISLDFIYGLPNQTLNDFKNDLKIAVELDITHISLYGLKIEQGCYFYKHKPLNLISEDEQSDYYNYACSFLNKNGFNQYEISNFSKKNYFSRHNINYWNSGNYYGFGVAACGYDGNVRYQNKTNLKKYIKNPIEKEVKETLTFDDKLYEAIILGFRMHSGIDVEKINSRFNINFEKKYKKQLEKFQKFIKKNKNGNYHLTQNGYLLSNCILSEFCEE